MIVYVFRRRRVGLLGRLVLQDLPTGGLLLTGGVAGHPADPLTAERARIVRRIIAAMEATLTQRLGDRPFTVPARLPCWTA